MSNLLLKKFGNELKELREKNNITIEQINTKTRIDKKYLMAIEEGDFSVLPEVYLRAFLKQYASAVQLSSSEILSKYEMAKEGLDYEKTADLDEPEIEKKPEEKIKKKVSQAAKNDTKPELTTEKKRQDKNLYYIITAIVMFLSIFIIYKVFLVDTSNEIITEKPFDEIIKSEQVKDSNENKIIDPQNSNISDYSKIEPKGVEQIKASTKIQSNNPVTNVVQPLQKGLLTLTIVGKGKSWIRTVSDGENNTEFMIENGVTKVVTAKDKFYLHIGNSGGVNLLLNNNDLQFKGSPGKVRKIFITQNGIEYLRRTPILNEEN